MKTRSLLLACAAGCTLALPAVTVAADAGTVTIDWNGSGFSINPTSLSAAAGDTFTVTYGTKVGGTIPSLFDGTGSFTTVNPGQVVVPCNGTPAAGGTSGPGTCSVPASSPSSVVFTVVTPGTLQVWTDTYGTLGSKQGEITVVGSSPSPTPTPTTPATTAVPTPAAPVAPPPVAQLLRSPTTQNTKASNRIGCSQVSVPLQLDKVGRYTFIYERSTGQSASARESQVTSTTRVTWNKGSTLGKRKLSKNSTAPVLVTTEANKRLVVNGLIKKAKADNLRLRVIHTAADGTLTQDVFDA